MKRIFCPHCDGPIVLTPARLAKAYEAGGRLSIVCPSCGKQLNARLTNRSSQTRKLHEAENEEIDLRKPAPAEIRVVENAFGYGQILKLREGANTIGRRNKDSVVDLPILTADPSMDRRHCIIFAEAKEPDQWIYTLKDDDSRVGTFLYGRELNSRERVCLEDGAIITLGATTLILAIQGSEEPEKTPRQD